MFHKMDELGFGNCTNEAECEASCPKGIDEVRAGEHRRIKSDRYKLLLTKSRWIRCVVIELKGN